MEIQNGLTVGGTQRASKEELRPGGKGLNISIMLRNLGVDSTAFGFVAGFSGDELMRLMAATGVKTSFIRVGKGRTRVNIRIKDPGDQTSINGLGPEVADKDIDYLLRKISSLTKDDYLVLAGMVPPSLPQDIYAKFFESLKAESKPKVIVDTPCEQFKYVLKYSPFLIKPNINELRQYTGLPLSEKNDVIEACHRLQIEGARNILVSLGKHGAIFLDEAKNVYRIPAPGAEVQDKTGAGDSMVAGFLADYLQTHSFESAAYMAVATGSATAITKGIATRDIVQKLRAQMVDQSDWGDSLI